jgi:acyl-CoA thioester hydrolase
MRLDLPDDKRLTFETTIPIRWGDMDAMGHVNNAVYFRYLETVRIDWLFKIGARPDPRGEGVVIVNTFCNFLRQVSYPGELIAKHYVGAVGRTSFDVYVTLARAEAPDVICASGGATTVWVNLQQEKAMPLPDWLRAVLTSG